MRGVDRAAVTTWLAANVDGAVAPFSFDLIAGGHSNLTYRVVGADSRAFVLRRPPLGQVLATAHDMVREHRIVSAVGRTAVPVAPTLGLCTDLAVNEAPFYVMAFVEGTVLDGADKAQLLSSEQRRALSEHLVDVLADLHAVDPDEVGLGDLARRTGYIERQVARWSAQWESSKTREVAAIDAVARELRRRMPVQASTAIAHGDYRFGNCLVDPVAGRVTAVLDWELCTLGDPLADVGYLGVYWSDPDRPARVNDPTFGGGFPTYASLLDRYAARTGRDLGEIDYYVAFSCWRLAVISEGVYARYRGGVMGDVSPEELEIFRAGAEQLAERALAALERR